MVAEYPGYREADVVLRDGSTVHLRPVRADDEAALLDLFGRLGPDSRMFRFFSGAPNLEQAAREMADVDYAGRYGLVATRGADETLVGHGTYVQSSSTRAEVAFALADAMQGQGLGTILLAHLAEVAEQNGVAVFVAEVLPQNHRMVEVFRESGFPVELASIPGAIEVELPTSFSAEAIERFEERDRLAAEAAVRQFLAALSCRDRRLAPPRHRRRRGLPQPARLGLRRRRLPGQPGERGGAVGARLSLDRGDSRRGRPGGDRGAGRSRRRAARASAPSARCRRWSCSRPASPRWGRPGPSANAS